LSRENKIEQENIEIKKQYGGINRLYYFLGSLCLIPLNIFLLQAKASNVEPFILLLISITTLVLTFLLVTNRLRNIGMSKWWFVLMIVPLVNIIIGMLCLVRQEGYNDTKKLDSTGKIISGVFISGILLFVVVLLIIAFSVNRDKRVVVKENKEQKKEVIVSEQKNDWPVGFGYINQPINRPTTPHNVQHANTEALIKASDGNEFFFLDGKVEYRDSKQLFIFPGSVITHGDKGNKILELADYNNDKCFLPYGITVKVDNYGLSGFSRDRVLCRINKLRDPRKH
jgi:uncharacterized membrane protein YhaH (DUF805 family)